MFLSNSLSIVEIRWTKSRGTASFNLLVIISKLWLETSRGLNRLNKETPKFLRRPVSVESRSVRARKRVARCQQSAQQPLEKENHLFVQHPLVACQPPCYSLSQLSLEHTLSGLSREIQNTA